MIRFFSPVGPLLKGWLFSTLGWGLLSFALGWQLVRLTSMPWNDAARIVSRDWMAWALITPLLFRLVLRLPLEREGWKLALPVHLAGCAAAIGFCIWWSQLVTPPTPPWRGGGNKGRESAEVKRDGAGGPPAERRGRSPGGRGGPGQRSPSFGIFMRATMHLPVYVALVGIAHALYFYRRSQERERRALEMAAGLTQARLEALKMQLQPHFLFNALNSIAALVHKDPDAADEMLSALSELLRLTLETSGEQELPLRRELQFVERYLAIEHARFGDRLQFEMEIAPDTAEAQVPTFLLQPLVENAVRHGLEPRSGEGLLRITTIRDADRLIVTVRDNGAGLPAERPEREGIGLANTRARLRELYGDRASLELRNAGGLAVIVTLPFHTTS
jgi:two-component sensor histidine kinase